jgi:hypothetical protein
MFNRNRPKFQSIFSCKRQFEPAVVVEEIDEDGQVFEELKPVQKKKKGPKYLPGERLLLKLNKQNKEKKKDPVQIDIDKVSTSISNVLKLF